MQDYCPTDHAECDPYAVVLPVPIGRRWRSPRRRRREARSDDYRADLAGYFARQAGDRRVVSLLDRVLVHHWLQILVPAAGFARDRQVSSVFLRSEEHTSEIKSL